MTKFIHSFIHQMVPREKAYFKRYAQMQKEDGRKNFLLLYEYLESLEKYDGPLVKDKFSGLPLGRHLSSELTYLKEQLLRSMASYHLDDSPFRQLHKLTHHIDLLIERGFRKQALKIVKKAKRIASLNEEFSASLKLIEQEEEIIFREGIFGFTHTLELLSMERQNISSLIQNANELRLLKERIREIQYSVGYISDPEQWPDIFNHPLMESEANALSITAKEHWFYIQEMRYYLVRDYTRSLQAQKRYLAFMDEHPSFFQRSKFLPVLSNYLLAAANGQDERAFNYGLSRLKDLESDPTLDRWYINYVRFVRILDLEYRLDRKDQLRDHTREAEQFLLQNIGRITSLQSNFIFMLIVRSLIELKEYLEAQEWMQRWHQHPIQEHTLIHLRLMTLFIYESLKLKDLLRSELSSGYKVLKRHQKYNSVVQAFYTYFRTVLNHPESRHSLLVELRQQVVMIKRDPGRNQEFEYVDFQRWVDQQLESSD